MQPVTAVSVGRASTARAARPPLRVKASTRSGRRSPSRRHEAGRFPDAETLEGEDEAQRVGVDAVAFGGDGQVVDLGAAERPTRRQPLDAWPSHAGHRRVGERVFLLAVTEEAGHRGELKATVRAASPCCSRQRCQPTHLPHDDPILTRLVAPKVVSNRWRRAAPTSSRGRGFGRRPLATPTGWRPMGGVCAIIMGSRSPTLSWEDAGGWLAGRCRVAGRGL